MSDQMPDEVWLRRIGTWVRYPEGEHRYIRAGLMDETTKRYTASARGLQRQIVEQQKRAEQAESERDDARARVEHLLTEICGGAANRHALAERCREVTAERDRLRDRLRAALEEIRDWPEDWRRDGWAVAQEFQGIAQEALDHD